MDIAGLPPTSAVLVAFAAGLVSFLSPCVAPLLPGYLAFVGAATDRERGARPLARALGFVAGFVLLFALLGVTAAGVSRSLGAHRAELELVSGSIVALLGLATCFDRSLVPAPVAARLQRGTARMHAPSSALAALPVGAAFAVAWTPCIGPALAAILAIAAGDGDPSWGALLLVVYGLGLGVPFVAAALALERIGAGSRRIRRHARFVRVVSGALLVVVGVAIATGGFGDLASRLARSVPDWLA